MIDPTELHAWADGEVSRDREEAVRRLWAESAEASAELESIYALKRFLRDRTAPVECRAEWRRCVVRLNEVDRTSRVERLTTGRFAWVLSGGLFAMIIVAGFLHRGTGSSNVSPADLARVLGTFHTPTRNVTSPETNEFLNELIEHAKVSIDPHRLSLVGRDYGDLDGVTATRYMFRDATGDFDLFAVPAVLEVKDAQIIQQGGRELRPLRLGGHNAVAWTSGRGTLMIVGDRSFDDLAVTASELH